MLLAINANNTNTVFGLCSTSSGAILSTWRVSTHHDRMPDEWYALLSPLLAGGGFVVSDIEAVIIGSVVPSVTRWLVVMCHSRLGIEPVIVSTDLDIGFHADVDQPSDVGADRIANSVAAFTRYGGPAIVVDFGTATNFDVVSADGHFIGGAIAPGLIVSLESLTARAARLFSVDIALPPRTIGKNTVTNIQSGVVLGHLAMVEGLIARIRAELDGIPKVIATGGLAPLFAGASSTISDEAPNLTLDGLSLIYQRLQR